MKLATLRDDSRDGQLVVVSRDLRRAVRATHVAKTLLAALESWENIAPALVALFDELERGRAQGEFALAHADLASPLPRTWQWLDGSAFHSHGELMQRAFKHEYVDELAPRRRSCTRAAPTTSWAHGKTCRCLLKPTGSTSKPRSPSSSIACRWGLGLRGPRAHKARDARERREPARARRTGNENRFRLDPREARHELQPSGRDARRARCRLGGRARAPAARSELERAAIRPS